MQNKEKVLTHEIVVAAIERVEKKLGEFGKMVVRPSGTEPLVRIMAQGPDKRLLEEVIHDIKEAISKSQEKE